MKPHSRLLELSLLANFVIHGVALLGMAVLLLPSLPGGTAPSDTARVLHIAEAPWLFRLGWLPWQLCAAADIGLAVALLRTAWISRAGAASSPHSHFWPSCLISTRSSSGSRAAWLVMSVAVVSPLLPADMRSSAAFVSTANGLGFAQLQLWLGLVTWEVRRRRSDQSFRDETAAFRDEAAA